MTGEPAVIRTRRLVLKRVTRADEPELHALFIDPEVRRFLWDDRIIAEEETHAIVEQSLAMSERDGTGLWMARSSPETPAVGFCGYWPFHDQIELLYGLSPSCFGRGLATEMAGALLRYGFEELNMPSITGSTDAAHAASVRVMERLGMRPSRTETIDGLPTAFFRITRDEWVSANARPR